MSRAHLIPGIRRGRQQSIHVSRRSRGKGIPHTPLLLLPAGKPKAQ